MLCFPISIFGFISILNVIFCTFNTCEVVFGKIYMLRGHYFWFETLLLVSSTKSCIHIYPNRSVRCVHYALNIFGCPTEISAEHILVFGVWTTIFHFILMKIGWIQCFYQPNWLRVLFISCMYGDHINFMAINNHTKWWSRMIVHKTNVMRVHFELFMDISIVDEHGLRLHNCQLILWPKSLCQSCTGINIKCQQGQENAILIRDQWFTSILNMSDNVLLTNLNPIFNKFALSNIQ